MKYLFPAILIFLVISGFYWYDDISKELNEKFSIYRTENPSTNLYLHLDKSIYNPNEDVWFKAYVLSGTVTDNKVLYVRLTDHNHQIILRDQFPMNSITSHGNILLPDTLKDGKYYLYAYSDRMINFNENDVFVQPLIVQRHADKRFEAVASVEDSSMLKRGNKVNILVQAKEGIDLLKHIKGEYSLLDGSKVLKKGKITTNTFGEATISFDYPEIEDTHFLKVRVLFNRNSDFAELLLNLPHEANPVKINVFPEGGHLIDGIKNKVVIEALNVNRYPVSTVLRLFKGSREISRIKTSREGIATVNFTPDINSEYFIEIENKKSRLNFPCTIEPSGYSLKFINDSSAARKTVIVRNKGENGDLILGLRTATHLVWANHISIAPGDSAVLPFRFDSYKKEMLSFFICNDKGQVKAERMFLNPAKENYTLSVKPDKVSYGKRKRVSLTFDVRGSDEQNVKANLSVAVVEKSRIDPGIYRNILNSFYYRFLDGSNCNVFIPSFAHKDLDNLLISKKWLHADLSTIINYVPKGEPKLLENTSGVSGMVMSKYRKKVQLNELQIASKEAFLLVPLNENKSFSIPAENLQARSGNQWRIIENQDFQQNYTIYYDNYDHKFDECVTASRVLNLPEVFNSMADNKPVPVNKPKGIVQLREVVIKQKSQGITDFVSKNCKDYVCYYNILNCPNHFNHPNNFQPVDGGIYMFLGHPVMYHGCGKQKVNPIKNITIPKNFYAPDFETEQIPEQLLQTTLYWNPELNTTEDGKAKVEFHTTDLTGDFLVIVQGIDTQTFKPLFGIGKFNVK